MSAVIIERVSAVAEAARQAKHGERGPIYQAACLELGISLQTLHNLLNKLSVRQARKRRADMGDTGLTYDEAHWIGSYMLQHIRKNNKKNKPLKRAVDELRDNGKIVAARIDPKTGEIRRLSYTAIRTAMVGYGLHPDQVLAPEPVIALASEHPNWCWQIDASLCVLYKLPDKSGWGVEEVATTERYKNKLSHFARIEHRLVQRYLVTDHASCAAFIYYAMGGESTESLCLLLIEAIQQRGQYPFYGIPVFIMLDRGSANRSAMFRNLCQALGIKLIFAQRARAKGQVEKMHDVTELGLESGLKMATDVVTVDHLNRLGQRWMHWFNGTAIHSRHGMNRYAAWQLIKPTELITTELNTQQLLTLAREQPIERPVTDYLTVNYKGLEYDVSQVPGVMVKQKLLICRCGFQTGMAQAVLTDADGQSVFYQLPEKQKDPVWGWNTDAAMIGKEHKRHADTPAQTARKSMERQAMAAETDADAAKARKAKAVPFGGEINPYKEMEEYQPPAYLPKRGSTRTLDAQQTEYRKLNAAQMAKWLHGHLQHSWDKTILADVTKKFPDGATEPELEQVLDDLRAGRTAAGKAKLQAV